MLLDTDLRVAWHEQTLSDGMMANAKWPRPIPDMDYSLWAEDSSPIIPNVRKYKARSPRPAGFAEGKAVANDY